MPIIDNDNDDVPPLSSSVATRTSSFFGGGTDASSTAGATTATAATPLATNLPPPPPPPPLLESNAVGDNSNHNHRLYAESQAQQSPSADVRSADRSTATTAGGSRRSTQSLIGSSVPRLRCVARYGPFRPVALACCTALPTPADATTEENEAEEQRRRSNVGGGGGVDALDSEHVGRQRRSGTATLAATAGASTNHRFPTVGTTAAIAGPHGVAIFRTSRPHVPAIVLHHASPESSPVRSLAFQPCYPWDAGAGKAGGGSSGQSALLLAAARGSGVLVWDASGRSLSPLLGRLGHDTCYGDASGASSSGGGGTSNSILDGTSGKAPSNQAGITSAPKSQGGAHTSASAPAGHVVPPSSASSLAASPRNLSSIGRSRSYNPTYHSSYNTSCTYGNTTITSLCWRGPSSPPTLLTTSHSTVSIWDLRCWSSRMRPSVRFSMDGSANLAASPAASPGSFATTAAVESGFVHVASDESNHKFAVMDAGGVVRVYDDRGGRPGGSGGSGGGSQQQQPLCTFWAHDAAGVGVSCLPPTTASSGGLRSGWLTWGADSAHDAANGDGCVKVWRASAASNNNDHDPDSYWYMDPTAVSPGSTASRLQQQRQGRRPSSSSYELRASFGPTDLSCARVCPYPYVNAVVTVGVAAGPAPPADNDGTGSGTAFSGTGAGAAGGGRGGGLGGWQADLWVLNEDERDDVERRVERGEEEGSSGGAAAAAAVRGGDAQEGAPERQQSSGDPGGGNYIFGAELVTTFRGGASDDPVMRQMMGVSCDFGHLVAAELAVGPSPLIDCRVGGGEPSNAAAAEDDDDCELLLCCLSSTGYLTTHAVPEASLHSCRSSPAATMHGRALSSPTKAPSYRVVHPVIPQSGGGAAAAAGTDARLFRPSSDTSLRRHLERDTPYAGNLTSSANAPTRAYAFGAEKHISDLSVDDSRFGGGGALRPSVPTPAEVGAAAGAGGFQAVDPITQISRGVDGALMQFDMDESVPITLPGETGETGTPSGGGPPGTSAKSPGGAVVDVGNRTDENRDTEGQQASRPVSIDPFKAMNVPCPRLCGASFGRGGGGIVVFHNGEVRKLWSWFQSDQDGTRGASPRQKQQQQPLADSIEVDLAGRVLPSDGSKKLAATTRSVQQSPRTMLDLMRMNAAVKIAQWGVDDADGGATDKNSSSDDDSDGIDSDDSSNSSDDEDFHETFFAQQSTAIHEDRKGPKDTDDSYFSDLLSKPVTIPATERSPPLSSSPPARASTGQRRPYSNRKRSMGPSPDATFISPSMDHLAPIVTFTRKHDAMVLNGQCPELADGWDLGPWWLTSEGGVMRPRLGTEERQLASSRHSSRDVLDESWGWVGMEESDDPTSETGYGSMFPSLSRMIPYNKRYSGDDKKDENEPASPLSPSKSFPTLKYLLKGNVNMAPPLSSSDEKHQATVMGNIKNLFYSQSPGSLSAVPPDQNMMRKARGRSRDHLMDEGSGTRQALGVYTIVSPSQEAMSTVEREQLVRTVAICLHNASVCTELGQMGKADTWSLLGQVVDNLSKSSCDNFDGWGGALGRELVANILRFYEAQGDVQMLATIVCVLSGGRDRRIGHRSMTLPERGTQSGLHNLLPDDDRLLDAYIIRYSSLLYAWGKLTTRTELSKHLAYVFPGAGGEQLIPFERLSTAEKRKEQRPEVIPNDGVAPGITFAPLCPRCLKPANPETNVCDSCKDYAFRCAICTNAVRGLFTVCLTCGHGGHVEHVLPWFEKYTVCPTGCGCTCVLSTYTSEKGGGGAGNKPFQGVMIDSGGGQIMPLTGGGVGRRSIISGAALTQQRRPIPATSTGLELGSALGSVPFGAYSYQPVSPQDRKQCRRKSSQH